MLGSLPGRLHEVTGITRNVGEAPESPIGPPKAKAPEARPAAGPAHRHHRPPPTAQDLFDLDLNPDF
ncbi:hypothetical protein FRC03_004223 [Tulasnella sp. 419]|nr:hypothetical protein FRC03_004223 [Tulasnella sp. 419]